GARGLFGARIQDVVPGTEEPAAPGSLRTGGDGTAKAGCRSEHSRSEWLEGRAAAAASNTHVSGVYAPLPALPRHAIASLAAVLRRPSVAPKHKPCPSTTHQGTRGIRCRRLPNNVAMKPGIQLRQSQQLSLTPQLQQAIRLLQLSQIELQIELRELAEANPLIELDGEAGEDDASAEAPSSDNADAPAESPSAEAADDSEYWDENSPQVMEWAQSSRGFDDDDALDPQDAAPEGLRDHL